MNVKKAIKRIAALAAGTTMVTATIMGAMAYDLSDYPAPFVEDGVFGGKLVIGQTAKVTDVIGAIDIAASLQAAAKSPVDVDGNTESISVSGGVQIKSSSEDFNFGDELDDFETGGVYDDGNFPELLADGVLEDDDGTEYDFEQTITLGDAALAYDQHDDYGDDPVFHLDVGGATTPEIVYKVHFKDTVDATALDDSETIEMFGKSFTFDPDNANGDDFTLFGSDQTVVIQQSEPVTLEMDGEEYTIEVLGGNSDDSTAIVRVTGDGTETKTLAQGASRNMAGLEIYIDDVFISNIGEDTISVSIFVGSNKIVIPNAATSWTEIELNGEDNTDINARLTGTVAALTDIEFQIDPTEFKNADIDDEWDWIAVGEEFVDPLFGFSLGFESMSPSIEGREVVALERGGDVYTLSFVTNGGDDIELEVYEATSDTALALGEDAELELAASALAEDDVFILEDTETDAGDRETYVFEVKDLNFDATDGNEFTLRSFGEGSSETFDDGDEIKDTGVYGYMYAGALNLRNAGNTSDETSLGYVVADGGLIVTIGAVNATPNPDEATLTFLEDSEDLDEVAAVDTLSVTVTPDSTDDVALSAASWGVAGATAADTDGDYLYGVSDYGTWFEQERDNSGEYLKVYYSGEETDFNVFLNGPSAVVVKSGSSSGTAYNVNNFVVGQIAVYDNEATGLVGKTPLIVVGGPCVNTVAMSLMGNPEVCWEGFTEGKAMISFFADQNAVMVAGYSGEDTTGAAQVLAAYDEHMLSGSEVEVITTDLKNLEVNVVN